MIRVALPGPRCDVRGCGGWGGVTVRTWSYRWVGGGEGVGIITEGKAQVGALSLGPRFPLFISAVFKGLASEEMSQEGETDIFGKTLGPRQ